MKSTQTGYKRSDRVGDLLREEISTMIMRGELKDPRIGLVTITRVRMSADLKEARIYFSLIEKGAARAETAEGLNSACGYIRRALARRLNLRHIPSIRFFYDESLDYAEHIEEVLKKIGKGEAR